MVTNLIYASLLKKLTVSCILPQILMSAVMAHTAVSKSAITLMGPITAYVLMVMNSPRTM